MFLPFLEYRKLFFHYLFLYFLVGVMDGEGRDSHSIELILLPNSKSGVEMGCLCIQSQISTGNGNIMSTLPHLSATSSGPEP